MSAPGSALVGPVSMLCYYFILSASHPSSWFSALAGDSLAFLGCFLSWWCLRFLLGVQGETELKWPQVTIYILLTLCCGVFISLSVLGFYFMYEATLVPMLVLVLALGPQPERLRARLHLLLYTVACALPFLGYLRLTKGGYF